LRSKGDAVGGAIEEADAEIVFERFYLKRDCGLRKKKMFRSFAKIQMLCDGAKYLEAKVFQLGHVMIIHGNRSTWEPTAQPVAGFDPLASVVRNENRLTQQMVVRS